jgi:hypothetical protein
MSKLINIAVLPKLWETIDRISQTLGLELDELSDLLLLTEKQIQTHKQSRIDPSLTSIDHLSLRLNLSLEKIITGNIDYQALAQHQFGNLNYLPEKYQKCALGRRRANLVILNFIEAHFGWRERASILRHFQMNEAIFADPDAPISIDFGADLLEYLVKYRLKKSLIPEMGKHSFLTTSPAPVKNELIDCKSVSEVYERMCSHIVEKYFEKNFIYQIQKMNRDSCTVIAKPNSLLLEQLSQKHPFKPETEMIRVGIASAYPQILGLPSAIVNQTSSMWEGSTAIRYEINYEHAQLILKQRIKSVDRPISTFLN